MEIKKSTIPSHTYDATSNEDMYRFVDREGNWTHYYIKSKKKFVPAISHVIKIGFPKGERFYQYLLSVDEQEAERRLKTSGDEGARTHDAIRDLIHGKRITLETVYFNELTKRYEPLNADEWNNIDTFLTWCVKYNPHVLIQEYAVWSEVYTYAGTLDFLGTIQIPEGDSLFDSSLWGKRIFVLIDWKTSRSIWDEYELQTAAYRRAVIEKSLFKKYIKRFGSLWTSVVRVGTAHKSGYEMKVWNSKQSDKNFELFIASYQLYKRKVGEVMQPELRQLPIELEVKIPKISETVSVGKARVNKSPTKKKKGK